MIIIKLNQIDFEYDIQGVIRGFFPNQPTVTNQQEDGFLTVCVDYWEEKNRIEICVIERHKEEICASIENDFTDRKNTKNNLKLLLYDILSDLTGRILPWGTLSGVRPVKIPAALLENGHDDIYIKEYMKRTYLVSDEKIDLSIRVAKNELAILKDIDYTNGYSVYISIPFCNSTCLYCSFTSYPVQKYKDKIDAYIDALCMEIDEIGMRQYANKQYVGILEKNPDSIYVGGGTPSALEPYQLEKVLCKIKEAFDFNRCKEFTVEAGRPDSITKEKLMIMKRYGVTRISVNPQTMKQKTLNLIGRNHTPEQALEAFALARECGFDNINMDYIVGLPEETIDDVKNTMERVLELKPDGMTIHSLAVKRAARLNMFKEEYEQYTFENDEYIMKLTEDYANRMGMEPYYLYRQKNIAGNMENVGYAVPNKAGIYNILIMEEKQSIMAAGAGAVTKFANTDGKKIRRVENVKDVDLYIKRVHEMIERKV